MGTFLAEFAAFVESIILAPEPLIIAGDFSIHVDRGNECNDAARFLDILQSMGLAQHVDAPTHEDGHTLDLIMTRSFDRAISVKPVVDTYVSDHVSVLCDINAGKQCRSSERVSFRKIKSIDIASFREQIASSEICTKEFSCRSRRASGLL